MSSTSEEYIRLLSLYRSGGDVSFDYLKSLEENIRERNNTSDEAYQRVEWNYLKEAIKEKISGLTSSNIKEYVVSLFKLNLVRGRGLLVRSVMKLQLLNNLSTPLLASLISVLNSKIPEIGELLGRRLILQFKKSYMRNDERVCNSAVIFIGQLVNVKVVHEILVLQIIQLLLTDPTDDSIELAISLMKVVGSALNTNSRSASNMIFSQLKTLKENNDFQKKTRSSIYDLLRIKSTSFADYPPIEKELDLVEDEDQKTHILQLELVKCSDDKLNTFIYDKDFDKHNVEYDKIREEILGSDDDDDDDEEEEEEEEEREEEENDEKVSASEVREIKEKQELLNIKDMTETNLLEFQKKVYLTIMSSMSSDEAVHKLLKLSKQRPRTGQDDETLVDMVIRCCAQEKTYSKYFGVIGEKLIALGRKWHDVFVTQFKHYYQIIHQFETNGLRNIGKFFGHLFASDKLAIEQSWDEIKMTEGGTNSATRVLLKFIFQEMVEEIGINELKARIIEDDYVKPKINGLFPVLDLSWRDAEHVRFAVNFFTAIGLGVLTEEMREVLKKLSLRGRALHRDRALSASGSESFSRSTSGSYSRSRSLSYSRSRSLSYSRSSSSESQESV